MAWRWSRQTQDHSDDEEVSAELLGLLSTGKEAPRSGAAKAKVGRKWGRRLSKTTSTSAKTWKSAPLSLPSYLRTFSPFSQTTQQTNQQLSIQGMHCSSCSSAVEGALR